jgi:hypothetical protein
VAGEKVHLQKLVWSWADALAPLYSTTTHGAGHFVFEKVPAGEFQISLAARAWQKRSQFVKGLETPVRIAAGEIQTVRLVASGRAVTARLRPPPALTQVVWTNALAVLRRDVVTPPEPAQGDFVNTASLRAERERYAHDPLVLAAVRQTRTYIGTMAADGLVSFANIPAGRYVFEVQFLPQSNERNSAPGPDRAAICVKASVSVPEAKDASDEVPVSIGDFAVEPL